MFVLISLFLAVDQSPGDAGAPLPYGSPASPGGPYKPPPEEPQVNLVMQHPVRLYGERSEDEIWVKTRREAKRAQLCYEWVVRRDPELRGEVTVEFIIQPDGRVSGVRLLDMETELEDEDLRQCVGNAYRKIRFAETEGPVAAFTQQLDFSLR